LVESIAGLFAAFGLSASAGLNAYVPLLIVALMARFTDWITLSETWEPLTSWWTIAVLVILGVIEFFVDKVPAVNHVNDAIQTFIRPTAGAVLFAASTSAVTNIHPVLAIIAGILVSGSVHVAKSARSYRRADYHVYGIRRLVALAASECRESDKGLRQFFPLG
jgi:uncharacterized membrane protein